MDIKPVTIEDLLRCCGSAYQLVILAAQRAKAIAQGAPKLVETAQRKATSIALEEILQGQVHYKAEGPVEGLTKRGRVTTAKKEEKKKRDA